MSVNILAIETSSNFCSIALLKGGTSYSRHICAPQRHGELVYGLLDEILAESELRLKQVHAIAFGCGPGSFTGLRIAAALSQALAFSLQIPVIPVSSLHALTYGQQAPYIITAVDARMEEVYWAAYKRQGQVYISLCEEQVCQAGQIQVPAEWQQQTWLGLGSGFQLYTKQLSSLFQLDAIDKEIVVNSLAVAQMAKSLYLLGIVKNAGQAVPVYIRNQVVG